MRWEYKFTAKCKKNRWYIIPTIQILKWNWGWGFYLCFLNSHIGIGVINPNTVEAVMEGD